MSTERDLSREAHLWYVITSPSYLSNAKPLLELALNVFSGGFKKNPAATSYPPATYWFGVLEDIILNIDNALISLNAGNFNPMMEQSSRLMNVTRGLAEGVQWLEGQDNVQMLDLIDRAYSILNDFQLSLIMSGMYADESYMSGLRTWHQEVPKDVGIASNTILKHFEMPTYEVIGRPPVIPEYAADSRIICKTGEIVPWTGVWVPVTGMGTAALAFARQGLQVMQPAYELAREFAEGEYLEASKVVDTAWHPVKPTGRMVPLPPLGKNASTGPAGNPPAPSQTRCEAGHPCPHSGYWFTPARQNSRRRFEAGEVMPEMGGDYGATIWQWDDSQG